MKQQLVCRSHVDTLKGVFVFQGKCAGDLLRQMR